MIRQKEHTITDQYLNEVPIEEFQKLLKDWERMSSHVEDYEACGKLKAYIDSRIRDNKLKEVLDYGFVT